MIVILLVISCLFVNMVPSYSAQVTTESFPSPPWVQKGNAYVQVFDVPLSVAKECVPSDFNIVETKEGSGLTEGSLYIAKYNNQSTIEYSELIFICATVQYEGKKGNWVHAIYVDNDMAKDAGINVWGLPKKRATFEWDRNTSPELQHVVVDVTNNEAAAVIIDATFNDNTVAIVDASNYQYIWNQRKRYKNIIVQCNRTKIWRKIVEGSDFKCTKHKPIVHA